jgi:hypothetical protein
VSSQSSFALGRLAGFGHDTGGFGPSLFHQMRGLLLARSANFGGTGASLLDLGLDALFSGSELGLGLVGRSQTIGDLLASFVECLDDRRPDEAGGKPPERQKDGDLDEKRRVDIHERFPPRGT